MKNKNLLIVIFLVALLAIVQLLISHKLATMGERLRQTEKIASRKVGENQNLEEEIGKIGSLANISSQAQSLGFVRTTQVLHLVPQIPVALK